MKNFFLVICFFVCFHGVAQDEAFVLPVNMEFIATEIADENSINYYPKLMKRFDDFDKTLTTLDYRFLYYGFTKQSNYSGYKTHDFEDEILKTLNKKTDLSTKDFNKLEVKLKEVLQDNPFKLKMLRLLIYVSDSLDKKTETEQLIMRFNGIIEAIISSGDGLSCMSGFKVISVSDEYIILDTFGLNVKGQSLVEGPCDLLHLADPNEELKIDGLYFDIEIFFGKMFSE